ncbi:hypothetical protein AAFN60_18730 [Roseibacillus persicicus]|uniref:hypothetical protein n=1 Tax=Roseibacillus persicicus TaxID=454148 RepID=UPI00398B0CCD
MNPFYGSEIFLGTKGSGQTGTARPFILPSVKVTVEPEEKLSSFDDSQLANLAETLAAGVVSNPAKLTVAIKGDDFELRSWNNKGDLGLNNRAQVLIHFNFPCHLYVWWITCEKKVVSLYPENKATSGAPKLISDGQGQRTLIIPEHEQMQIKASPGHEICMVCVSRISLETSEVTLLDEKIRKAISSHDGSVLLEETSFREYSLSQKKRRLVRRRFGEVDSPTGWEADLVKGVKELLQTVYLYYIPNRGE